MLHHIFTTLEAIEAVDDEFLKSYNDVKEFLDENNYPMIVSDSSNYNDVLHSIIETHAWKFHSGESHANVTCIQLSYDDNGRRSENSWTLCSIQTIELEAHNAVNVTYNNGRSIKTYLFDDNEYDWL